MVQANKPEKLNLTMSNDIGCVVRAAIVNAQNESRLIIGLSDAVKSLSKAPSDALFCLLAPSATGGCVTHMQEVLLQAYCFENDIYIIKVSFIIKLKKKIY